MSVSAARAIAVPVHDIRRSSVRVGEASQRALKPPSSGCHAVGYARYIPLVSDSVSPEIIDRAALARLGAAVPPLVRFGTSSWNYPGWRGLVYQQSYKGKGVSTRMLEEYARFPLFRTVGIDASFYAAPTPDVLRGWAERLPAGFPCVSKVWQQLTVHTWTRIQDPEKAGKPNHDFLNPNHFDVAMDRTCVVQGEV